MNKIVASLLVVCFLFVGNETASAHNLPAAGSESAGWKYVGAHWPTKSTKYFEATTST